MMIVITGTPGTGKTTVTNILKSKIDAMFISINSLLDDYDLNRGTDEKRGYKIVDTKKMIPIVDSIKKDNVDKDIIFEGHLAQDYPNADLVIVLRCRPDILEDRLNTRHWKQEKVNENVSAEILGVCTSESYETYGEDVQEIDTSSCEACEIADIIVKIMKKEVVYPLGEIDFLEDYFELL